jgi:hypothetical protein
MKSPIDQAIKLMAVGAAFVSLLVVAVFSLL